MSSRVVNSFALLVEALPLLREDSPLCGSGVPPSHCFVKFYWDEAARDESTFHTDTVKEVGTPLFHLDPPVHPIPFALSPLFFPPLCSPVHSLCSPFSITLPEVWLDEAQ